MAYHSVCCFHDLAFFAWCSLTVQKQLYGTFIFCINAPLILLQEMKRADAALERALYDTEDIDMDSVFLAIDAYRNSILLTRCGTYQ